jgi:hypothetical protein
MSETFSVQDVVDVEQHFLAFYTVDGVKVRVPLGSNRLAEQALEEVRAVLATWPGFAE